MKHLVFSENREEFEKWLKSNDLSIHEFTLIESTKDIENRYFSTFVVWFVGDYWKNTLINDIQIRYFLKNLPQEFFIFKLGKIGIVKKNTKYIIGWEKVIGRIWFKTE